MPGPITKQQTRILIKKLEAVDETDRSDSAHDIYAVYHEGILVASFGVRRSSKKDMPHPHIPGDLGVNAHYTREIVSCKNNRDDWLRERGLLPSPEETEVEDDE